MDATQTCKRYCCGLKYTERENGESACKHHPSPPSFRDGVREWPCCSKRAPDFEGLLSIPPCAVGRHSSAK